MSKADILTHRDRILRSKVRRLKVRPGTVWCGYLSPVEILHIVDVWQVEPEDSYAARWINHSRECVKRGLCNRTWFYFTVTKADQQRLQLGD